MADTKISALPAASSVIAADEFPINEAGASKKVTALQLKTYINNAIKVAAGSATADTQPIELLTGPLLTTPEAGSIEYLTNTPYFTPNASNRGVIPAVHFAAIQSDFTLAAASGVQNCLTAANDTLTLPGTTTYFMDGQYIINTGATTHTTAMAFLLTTMTVTSLEYTTNAWSAAANTIGVAQTCHVSGVASKVITATSTAVYTIIRFFGVLRVNVGGSIAPQIDFSANPTGTNLMKVGSYIRFYPVGDNAVAAVGNWA